ncbi:MAG: hypothetical protein AAF799_01280 [Myxococcota bacterium]
MDDEHQDVVIAEGLIAQRSFRAVDPRVPDRDPLHTVTLTIQVERVEPLEAAPWLGESVVFERRTTRQDADLFAGTRVRVSLDPRRRRDGPWRGLHVEMVEPSARPPCPDGAPSGTIPVTAPLDNSPPPKLHMLEGRVVARHFESVQKVNSAHPGYEPLQRVIFELDVRSSAPPGLEQTIAPPLRVTRTSRASELEIRAGDIIRVAFEPRPGVLDNPAKLLWGQEITLLERACGTAE